MKNSNREKLIETFKFELRRMATDTYLFANTIANKTGINETDMKCAEIILKMGSMPVGQLAKLSGLTTGAITGVVDRLEKAGWAQRESDPNDRRKVIIKVMPERPKSIDNLYDSYNRQIDELIGSFTTEDLDKILDFVKNFSEISFKAATEFKE